MVDPQDHQERDVYSKDLLEAREGMIMLIMYYIALILNEIGVLCYELTLIFIIGLPRL